MDTGISVLDWPSRSPDLNPIENILALLVRDVYSGFRQLSTKMTSARPFTAAWERIQVDTLKRVIASMPNRCMDVIQRRDGPYKLLIAEVNAR